MTTPTGTIERISREEFETKRPKRYGGALPSPETKEFLKLAVDGAMKAAVMQGGFDGNSTTISLSDSDIPYATKHHEGSGSTPARRVFPIGADGEVLDWTKARVVEAARAALQEALS